MRVLSGAGVFQPGWVEHLRTADLSVGTYGVAAGGHDGQRPHTEDEIYVVTAGRARLSTPTATVEVRQGSVVFVPAGEPHRFLDISDDLAVLVMFGPAEYSRSPLAQPGLGDARRDGAGVEPGRGLDSAG